MIQETKFQYLMKDLEMMFSPITKGQMNKYYERLKYNDEEVFVRAVNYLMDTHPYKRFPLIQEFNHAITWCQRESPKATAKELDFDVICYKCNETGFVLSPVLHLGKEYMTAFHCECPKGQRIKVGWKNYLESEKRKRGIYIKEH